MGVRLRHDQVGVIGDRSSVTHLRVEFQVDSNNTLALEGADQRAHYALFPGQIRCCNWKQPVVIKIQRDICQPNVPRSIAYAWFDWERQVYLNLQKDAVEHQKTIPLINYYDLFVNSNSEECPELPPTILCRYAQHALQPRCPECGGALDHDSWAHPDTPTVVCDSCHQGYGLSPPDKERIILATVRNDSACRGCTKTDEECRQSAFILNLLPARFHVLEHYEITLADYLDECSNHNQRGRHATFWHEYQLHCQSLSRIQILLNLFLQLLSCLQYLHFKNVAHCQLVPRNLALTFAKGVLRVRLLGLGASRYWTSATPTCAREKADSTDHPYIAPELLSPIFPEFPIECQFISHKNYCELTLPTTVFRQDETAEPSLLVGDALELRLKDGKSHDTRVFYLTIGEVTTEGNQYLIRVPRPDIIPPDAQSRADVRVLKHIGPAADMFSLGMILLRLLVDEAAVQRVRNALPGLLRSAQAIPSSTPLTPCLLTHFLGQFSGPNALLHDLVSQISTHCSVSPVVAMDLVGVTLRLLLRTPQSSLNTYKASRSDDSTAGLSRLHSDIGCILAALVRAQRTQHNTWYSSPLLDLATSVREELAKLGFRRPEPSHTHIRVQSPEELAYLLNRGTLVDSPAMIAAELWVAYSMTPAQVEFLLRGTTEAGTGTSPSREELIPCRELIDEVALLSYSVQRSDYVLRQLQMIDQRLAADSIEEDIAQVTNWRKLAMDVLGPVYKYNQCVDDIEQFFQHIHSLAVQHYAFRSGTESHPRVVFRLGDRLLSIINPSHVGTCFNQCLSCLHQGEILLKRMKDRCSRVHQMWQRLPPSLREATRAVVGRMVSRADAVAASHRDDVQEAERLIADLRSLYNNVRRLILDPWERHIVQRPNASLDTATVPISTVLLNSRDLWGYDLFRIGKIVADLREINCGAAFTYTALLLIDEARSLLRRHRTAHR